MEKSQPNKVAHSAWNEGICISITTHLASQIISKKIDSEDGLIKLAKEYSKGATGEIAARQIIYKEMPYRSTKTMKELFNKFAENEGNLISLTERHLENLDSLQKNSKKIIEEDGGAEASEAVEQEMARDIQTVVIALSIKGAEDEDALKEIIGQMLKEENPSISKDDIDVITKFFSSFTSKNNDSDNFFENFKKNLEEQFVIDEARENELAKLNNLERDDFKIKEKKMDSHAAYTIPRVDSLLKNS